MVKDALRPKMPDSGNESDEKSKRIAKIRADIQWQTSVATSPYLQGSMEASRQTRKIIVPSLHNLARELEALTGEKCRIDIPELRKIPNIEDYSDGSTPRYRERKTKW